MKALLISTLLLGIALFVWQCKATKYTADTLPKTYIKWGNGGGFVGKETAYMMLENGQVFKHDGVKSSMEELKSIKGKTANALFSAIEDLEMEAMQIDQGANVYYFLEMSRGDTPVRLTWGDKTKETPKQVKDMYVVLGQLVN